MTTTTRVSPPNKVQWMNSPMLNALAGTVVLGIATTAYAQACDPVEVSRILPSDAMPQGGFGGAVSVDADTIIAGRVGENNATGTAYIFTFDNGAWTEQAKLLADDGEPGDRFGDSVSISGDTVIVGASRGDGSGTAYIFTRAGGVWTQQTKLVASDAAFQDEFGISVAINGDTAIIGANLDDDNGSRSGSAYIFTNDGGVWSEQAKIIPSDGASTTRFGSAVAIDGDTAIIGSDWDDDNGFQSGSAYIFTRTQSTWTQQAKLLPEDGMMGDWFGASVSISGDTGIVGAFLHDNNGENGENSGSAYIFARDAGVWTQQAELIPDDIAQGDIVGANVAISGDIAIVSSQYDDDNGNDSGSAYVFTRDTGVWSQHAKLLPADNGAPTDWFGYSVSISGQTAVIGSVFANSDAGFNTGAAHIYSFDCADCPADLDGNSVLNFFDVSAFLTAYNNQDPIADFNDDGNFNFFDVSVFLQAFKAGCP